MVSLGPNVVAGSVIFLSGADRLAEVDRGDLERHGGGGGLDRGLRSGRHLRAPGAGRRLLLLLAAEQREAAYEDQGRGAMEAHGSLLFSHSEGILRV